MGGARHSRGVHGWLAPIFSKAVLFILVAVLIQSASAQVGAAISGRVVDATGAGVEDATVTIKSVETGATRTVISGSDGSYRIPDLEPGRYTVWVDRTRLRTELEIRSEEKRVIELSPDAAASHADSTASASEIASGTSGKVTVKPPPGCASSE